MPLYTVSMYYGISILKKVKKKDILFFAVASALCTSVRIVGGTLVLALCMILLYRSWGEDTIKKEVRRICGICYCFGLAYFATMPKLWSMVFGDNIKAAVCLIIAGIVAGLLGWYILYVKDTKGIKIFRIYVGLLAVALTLGLGITVKYWIPMVSGLWLAVKKVFSVFGNYTIWKGEVFYLGEWIAGYELPWHYVFVWMGISIPTIYVLLFFAGSIYQVRILGQSIQKKKVICVEAHYCFWLWWIPVVYLLAVNPVLYNGWRHFYFIYNVIALTAIMGLRWMGGWNRHRLYHLGLAGSVVVCVMITGGWILRNHPHEYTYFSPLFRSWAVDNFDRDYWCMAEQKSLRYILEIEDGDETIDFAGKAGITLAVDPEHRLKRVNNWWDAEYVMAGYEGFEGDYYFNDIYSVCNGDGLLLDRVWKRAYYQVAKSVLILGESQQQYQNEGAFDWRVSVENDSMILLGEAENVISADRIAVFLQETWLEQSEIMVSTDGNMWHDLRDFSGLSVYGGRISADCGIHDVKYIQIKCPAWIPDGESMMTIAVELAGSRETVEKAKWTGLVETVSTNGNELGIMNIVDGDEQSHWESSQQTTGLSVTVELKREMEFAGVVLDSGERPWDYPRNLQIEVSMDGEQWISVKSTTQDHQLYLLEEQVRGRYVRLCIGATDGTEGNWSIYELYFLKALK